MIRNAALALATGGEFAPVVRRGAPRKVLVLNFEGAGSRFQNDLEVMTSDRTFDDAHHALLAAHLFPVHAPLVDGEPLTLSRHLAKLEFEARRLGVDVIIVDTATAGFEIRNENDNAEIQNFVMKPLLRLARRVHCLVVLVHHIGKAKMEAGNAREGAHRARGASAWGDFSTSIFNLEADKADTNRVTLECAKRKDGENYECSLRLDRAARWYSFTDERPPALPSNDELVLEAMRADERAELRATEIIHALAGRVSKSTVKRCLERLAARGQVKLRRRGVWTLTERFTWLTAIRDEPNEPFA